LTGLSPIHRTCYDDTRETYLVPIAQVQEGPSFSRLTKSIGARENPDGPYVLLEKLSLRMVFSTLLEVEAYASRYDMSAKRQRKRWSRRSIRKFTLPFIVRDKIFVFAEEEEPVADVHP